MISTEFTGSGEQELLTCIVVVGYSAVKEHLAFIEYLEVSSIGSRMHSGVEACHLGTINVRDAVLW